MKFAILCAILISAVSTYNIKVEQVALTRHKRAYTCADYPAEHSICKTDVGTITPLTDKEKQDVLDRHNELRSNVDPPAEDMLKMYWDEELAAIAAKWSAQCIQEHDENPNRLANSLPGTSIGQNLAYGYSSYVEAVDGWYSEVKDFEYDVGALNGGVIGHFTQVVLANAARIGCAKSDCTGLMAFDTVYACNYATGQTSDSKLKPYCTGSACNTCTTKDNNLCDCEGKVCFNGGTFDITTCECRCSTIFKGPQCEELVCPAANQDYSSCTDPANSEHCKKFANYGPTYCPFFCGLCPNDCSIACENGGSVNSVPCTCLCPPGFSGEFCQIDENQGVCGGLRCDAGFKLYVKNCHCAEEKVDCVGRENESPYCPYAWCDSANWVQMCPHTCAACGT